MFGLFRKSRQEIITEEKSRRYLRYAVGEMVLVVAGILIALQIDSWNDDRQDRQREREIVASMLNDVHIDNEQIIQAIDGNIILVDALNRLLNLINNVTDDPQVRRDLFLHSVVYTYWYLRVDFSNLTMSQLSSGGNLFLVRDKQVRDAMLAYKRGLEAYRHQDTEMKHYFHVQEESQKQIFNLALAKKAYELIESDYTNILKPLDPFDPLVSEGDYVIDDDPKLLAKYYGDVLFYRTTVNNTVYFLEEQKKLGDKLASLIEENYGIR
jgi:hypothetical protein